MAGVENVSRQHEMDVVISGDPGGSSRDLGEIRAADKPAGHRSYAQRNSITRGAHGEGSALCLVETRRASIHLEHLACQPGSKGHDQQDYAGESHAIRRPSVKPQSFAASAERLFQSEVLKTKLQRIWRLLFVPGQFQVPPAQGKERKSGSTL